MTGRPQVASPPRRGATSTLRAAVRATVQLAIGGAIVVGLFAVILKPAPAPSPPGWRVYRPPHEVSTLALIEGIIWAGGNDGLTLVDSASGEFVLPPSGMPTLSQVRKIARDPSGPIWIAHGQGVTRYVESGNSWTTFGAADGALGGPVFSVLVDRHGDVWTGGERGLARYSDGRWQVFGKDSRLVLDGIDVLYEDRSGAIWAGSSSPTNGGLATLDVGSWRMVGGDGGLPHQSVNAIAEDDGGALWVGTGFADLGGVGRLKDGTWTRVQKSDGLAGGKVRSVSFDRSGRAWVGSEYDGIAVVESGKYIILTPKDGLSGWEVKAVVEDGSGDFWLGTEDGLTRISGEWLGSLAGKGGQP